MATTIAQIARYLDERKWTYEVDSEHDRIITGVRAENVERFLLAIALKEDGEYFSLAAPQLLNVREHIYKGVLFQTLLAMSWEMKMVRWEYNPMDGEIRAAIELPLEDNTLTQRQFERCLDGLIYLVDSVAMPRLLAVLETGADPGEAELGERLLLALQEMWPSGALTHLEKALAARKQRGVR